MNNTDLTGLITDERLGFKPQSSGSPCDPSSFEFGFDQWLNSLDPDEVEMYLSGIAIGAIGAAATAGLGAVIGSISLAGGGLGGTAVVGGGVTATGVIGAGGATIGAEQAALARIQANSPTPGIWSAGRDKKTGEIIPSVQNLIAHYNKHKSEFPGITSPRKYAQAASKLYQRAINGEPGIATHVRKDGTRVAYDLANGAYGVFGKVNTIKSQAPIFNRKGTPSTYFKPNLGYGYYLGDKYFFGGF